MAGPSRYLQIASCHADSRALTASNLVVPSKIFGVTIKHALQQPGLDVVDDFADRGQRRSSAATNRLVRNIGFGPE